MEAFDLTGLGGTFVTFVGILATITQFLKVQLGLKGNVVKGICLGLGVLLGVTGLEEAGRDVLPLLPGWLSGGLLGLLAGLVASGGKDLITGVQLNGAKARVEAEIKATGKRLEAQLDALPPMVGSQVALPDDLVPATIEDVLRHTGEWPAVPGLDDAPLDRGHP
ncbi:hypothetical protein GO986_16285 [Deinococcus sp. HMF7620]|uniref:Uncharacterized protein n=1 Tax=Deinococcus arboris TaxID=2682977 RepID=A0A7C9M832_9DEIO|nr:hypothetical protein [Deinococcus arboris]MVN88305.1 hypothetical protein [Deinococcus arboris]